MADAVINLKFTPVEYRRLRDSLETRQNDAHEQAREVRGEDPKLSRSLTEESASLSLILEKI